MDVVTEIMRRVEALPAEAQRQILDSLETLSLACPEGEPGSALAAFAGILDPVSAAEMRAAIEEEFEKVDLGEW